MLTSTQVDRENHNHDSDLLKLPPELRNRIYHFLVPRKTNIDTRSREFAELLACAPEKFQGPGWDQPTLEARQMSSELAILRVCRQIRRETASIYYGDNKFIIHMDRYLWYCSTRLLHTMGELGTVSLRNVHLTMAVCCAKSFAGLDDKANAFDFETTALDEKCRVRFSGMHCGKCEEGKEVADPESTLLYLKQEGRITSDFLLRLARQRL